MGNQFPIFKVMIDRNIVTQLIKRLKQFPAVVLIGARQVGKTTLAHSLKIEKQVHYLDLERPSDLAKLSEPELYLSKYSECLVILDEIQRAPEIFPILRSLIDKRKRVGEKSGHFLLLGSSSPQLLQQSSETLAGRISFIELPPLNYLEVLQIENSLEMHWFRGGYPDSFLSINDEESGQWCEDFISSYVERYLPQLGVTVAPIQLRRLLSMLGHQQGALLNLSKLGNSLDIEGKTVRHYLDLLEGLFIIRRLPFWSKNTGKRIVKFPKVYLRDSGILHTLLGLHSLEQVLGHPVCGHSWEGYCVEQIMNIIPKSYNVSHYRTHAGAEIDLVIEKPSGEVLAIEIKRTLSPKLSSSFTESMKTVGATKGYYLIPKGESFPLSKTTEAIDLISFLNTILIKFRS